MDSAPTAHRIVIVTTMFDHGGVTSYWRDVINLLPQASWLVFVNKVAGIDPDPFKSERVEVDKGMIWHSFLKSSLNLIRSATRFSPGVIIFNGTLAMMRVLPAILFFRVLRPTIRLQCIFHSGPIYPTRWKNLFNRMLISCCGALMHRNVFVSRAVQKYWWCGGIVWSRPFFARPRKFKSLRSLNEPEQASVLPIVGFLGRLSAEKDPDLFLRAMEFVRKKTPCTVVVAGLGSLRTDLENRYSWARFVGWIHPKEWLTSVDLLVTTSRTEGWPFAIGEAIECGTPVVGCAVGGVEEILSPVRGVALTWRRDAQSIATLVGHFLQDYSKCYRKYFENFERARGGEPTAQGWAEKLVYPP